MWQKKAIQIYGEIQTEGPKMQKSQWKYIKTFHMHDYKNKLQFPFIFTVFA